MAYEISVDNDAAPFVLVVIVMVLALTFTGGLWVARKSIIDQCIEANSDQPHNTVNKFCEDKLNALQGKK